MVTCLYFLSLFFQAVLLELEDSLDDVMWLLLCNVHGLYLLQSLQKLCDEDLLCGVSPLWQYVLEFLWHDVLQCVGLWYDLEQLLCEVL